tara:strand:- start:126 stop:257 length:132 start_codon:yes stop_codon:yes gene_type:complete
MSDLNPVQKITPGPSPGKWWYAIVAPLGRVNIEELAGKLPQPN